MARMPVAIDHISSVVRASVVDGGTVATRTGPPKLTYFRFLLLIWINPQAQSSAPVHHSLNQHLDDEHASNGNHLWGGDSFLPPRGAVPAQPMPVMPSSYFRATGFNATAHQQVVHLLQ